MSRVYFARAPVRLGYNRAFRPALGRWGVGRGRGGQGRQVTAETIVRTIQLIVAPVVMVTAGAILSGGLLSHAGAINDRLRALAHERLDLLRTLVTEAEGSAVSGNVARERVAEIDHQLPDLLGRHRIVHAAIRTVYGAIRIFVGSMLVIALAAVTDAAAVADVALLLFLVGTGVLLWSLVLTTRELRRSLRAVEYEVERIASLPASPAAWLLQSPSLHHLHAARVERGTREPAGSVCHVRYAISCNATIASWIRSTGGEREPL